MERDEAAKLLPKFLVKQAREGFPEIYAVYIQGRWREFIAEHAPPERERLEEDENREVLGPLPLGLKMLWAIAMFFDKNSGYEKWPESADGYTAEEVCMHLHRVNMWNFSNLVYYAFWEEVRHLFPGRKQRDNVLAVHHDYSVSVSPRNGRDVTSNFQRLAQISHGIVRCNAGITIATNIGFQSPKQ